MTDDQQERVKKVDDADWNYYTDRLEITVIKWRNKQRLGTVELVGCLKRVLKRFADQGYD